VGVPKYIHIAVPSGFLPDEILSASKTGLTWSAIDESGADRISGSPSASILKLV
jgi:hypothetical protein